MYVLHLDKTNSLGPLRVSIQRIHHDGSLEDVEVGKVWHTPSGRGRRVRRAQLYDLLESMLDFVAEGHKAMAVTLVDMLQASKHLPTPHDLALLDVSVVAGQGKLWLNLDRAKDLDEAVSLIMRAL